MAVIGAVNRGNDPFSGGSITRTGQANVSGGIGSASTTVSNPIAGVNAGTPFFARNNQGSNIPIPYTRLVPLGSKETSGIGLPPGVTDTEAYHMRKVVKETEDLRATTVAFILGKRSGEMIQVITDNNRGANDTRPLFDGDGTNGLNDNYGFALGMNTSLAPQMRGTERFQKLCSFEYLQRYFTNVLCYKKINLMTPITPQMTNTWDSGVLRMVKALKDVRDSQRLNYNGAAGADAGVGLEFEIDDSAGDPASVQQYFDITHYGGYAGSDAANEPGLRQGVFTRDNGPFLRGKGVEPYMVNAVKNMSPFEIAGGAGGGVNAIVQAFSMNRCLGDEVAFAQLEALLTNVGVTDWRPDGIVLSKGVNDPSDKMTDEMIEARDGQLFNMRIQGPAISTSWTGDPALETMPLDKVFIVIVADVWWGDNGTLFGVAGGADKDQQLFGDPAPPPPPGPNVRPNKDAVQNYLQAANPDSAQVKAYIKARDAMIASTDATATGPAADKAFLVGGAEWQNAQVSNYTLPDADARREQTTRLCNFRVMRATSSQMINYSNWKFEANGQQMAGSKVEAGNEFRRVYGQSRMGLKICKLFGEYIVGGWCIGNVLDTAASRGSMPGSGSNIGARTAPNSMALNINVQVEWWDADKMWRSFMDKDGLLTARYQPSKRDVGTAGDGSDGLSAFNMPPRTAIEAGLLPTKATRCLALDA